MRFFFTPALVFHKSVSDNKSPQVPGTLHSILVDRCNAAVRMISVGSLIYYYFYNYYFY